MWNKRISRMKNDNGIIFTFVFLLFLFLGGNAVVHFITLETLEATEIIKTERIQSRNVSKYLIYTNSEVFENVDSFWAMKWNSSDLYALIQVGDQCSFTVTGFRVSFLSKYRNILEFDCHS